MSVELVCALSTTFLIILLDKLSMPWIGELGKGLNGTVLIKRKRKPKDWAVSKPNFRVRG
jgi:hypothetical protein